jgi:hypothetical protein
LAAKRPLVESRLPDPFRTFAKTQSGRSRSRTPAIRRVAHRLGSTVIGYPKTDKDYPKGVWTLPPVLRLGEQDKEKYLVIGESDRMTLRSVKR